MRNLTTLDEIHEAEVDLFALDDDAAFTAKYDCTRDELYKRLYPVVFETVGKPKAIEGNADGTRAVGGR